MAPTKERPATKTIATSREARHEYFVLEALETGVELVGTEVKSLRAGGVNLKDSCASMTKYSWRASRFWAITFLPGFSCAIKRTSFQSCFPLQHASPFR